MRTTSSKFKLRYLITQHVIAPVKCGTFISAQGNFLLMAFVIYATLYIDDIIVKIIGTDWVTKP